LAGEHGGDGGDAGVDVDAVRGDAWLQSLQYSPCQTAACRRC
jgi:hypothetical protein